MKQNYTHIAIVLDRSGSMISAKQDTIGGFNAFLEAQKVVPGEATLFLCQFDHEYNVLQDNVPLAQAAPLNELTYVPRGNTALLDAIGRTIVSVGAFLQFMSEAERPEKMIFVIITDGMENSSREYSSKQIMDMINHQRDVYKWEFVFLGANQDAIATAAGLGIGANSSLTFANNSAGNAAAYASVARATANYRNNMTLNMCFTEEDRLKQKQAGA